MSILLLLVPFLAIGLTVLPVKQPLWEKLFIWLGASILGDIILLALIGIWYLMGYSF